jgi:hypothetical protein
MHILSVVNDLEGWRGVGVLAGRWRLIGGSWDSNGRDMMGDAYTVQCGGD